MVERSLVQRPFSSSSRSKFIKKDKEGVASVVGTLMALLIFLTLLTMFTNTYIPVWMKENEKTHMDETLTQFGEMKGKIDSLIVNAQVTQRPTIDMFQPIGLSADGVPIFAAATSGYVYLKPSSTYDTGVNVRFNYQYSSEAKTIDENGGGCVEFYSPNRYYVPQWYAYENGAIMVSQESGMALRATPSLVFSTNNDGTMNVQFDQVDLIGGNDTVGGLGTAGIVIDLIYYDSQSYDVCGTTGSELDGTLVIELTTRYNTTWTSFIDETAQKAGLLKGTNYSISQTIVPNNEYRPIYILTLTMNNVNEFTYNRAYVNLDLEY